MAIIHLAPTLPSGSSSLPGSARSEERRDGPPRSHFPIWPCTARSLPGRGLLPNHAGGLLPHRFTLYRGTSPRPVYSLLHLSSFSDLKISNLKYQNSENARSLSGSLPCGVRTFLCLFNSDRPTRFIARLCDYNKEC